MFRIRILTALVAVSLTGGLALASTTASAATMQNAAASRPVAAAQSDRPAAPVGCTAHLPDAVTWYVNAPNIRIRSSPAGPYRYPIARNGRFVSDVLFHGVPTVCIARHQSGRVRYWIYGYDRANSRHAGWIGCNYLNFDSRTTCIQYLAARGYH
jgi:hypothetical protein